MNYQFLLKNVRKEDKLGSVVIRSLRDINLEIEKGSFTTIYGPEGSGKSRLLSIMSLTELHSAGEFLFESRDISDLTEREISVLRAAKIGYVPQILNLNMTISVLENVSVAARIQGHDTRSAREKAFQWLDELDMSDKFNCTPLELTQLEIKKTGIAKAMIKNPDVLLIDEGYYRLPVREAEELFTTLYSINQRLGTTIVETARNLEISRPGPFVYLIQNGKTSRQLLSTTAA